jgi:hypothetical protein
MSSPHAYVYNGSNRASVIPLRPGWNLIGYPSKYSSNISLALGNISFTHIKMYNASQGIFLVYSNGSANNTFTTVETYTGYWINSSATQNWIITG